MGDLASVYIKTGNHFIFTPQAESPEGYYYHGFVRSSVGYRLVGRSSAGRSSVGRSSVGRRSACRFPLTPFFFAMAFRIDAKICTRSNLSAVSVIVRPDF